MLLLLCGCTIKVHEHMYHGTYVESGDNLVQFVLSFTFMWVLGT